MDGANRPALEVLLDDFPVLAVNKPAGLLTQGPPRASLTLETLVRDHIRERFGKQGGVYLGVPHRLDRAVTGVVVFARNTKGASRLAELFRDRRVSKTYWAVVEGVLQAVSGDWKDMLVKVGGEPRAMIVEPGHPGAVEASLSYRKLAEVSGGTLLEITPLTGRYHQIRAQLAHRGMPVVGDVVYGSRTAIDPAEAGWVDDGSTTPPRPIALHARRLELPHPVRFTPLTITAPAPGYWLERGWSAGCVGREREPSDSSHGEPLGS